MKFQRYCIIDGSYFETDDANEAFCPHCRAHREELIVKTEELISVNSEIVQRIPFGEEPERGIPAFDIADYNLPQCPECGAGQGEYHKRMCTHEICPCCGEMLISCDCLIDDRNTQGVKDASKKQGIPEPDLATIGDLGETLPEKGKEDHKKQSKPKSPCEWKPGQIIMDDYEVYQKIGEGGFCEVYKVRDRRTRQLYAVKCFKYGFRDLKRSKEIECLLRLQEQPNILQIHRAHIWQGIPLIFTELVDGGNLENWIRQEKFDLYEGSQVQIIKRIMGIALQTARALASVHAKRIVHLNVKPTIILLKANGLVKLGGFGIAQTIKEGQLSVTSKALTPAYCSPEQAQYSDLTCKSDIWSWAVSVLEMFSGGVFWVGGQIADTVFEHYLEKESDSNIPLMPSRLVTLLRECFRRDPKDRPKGMDWIVRFLQEIYQEEFGEAYLLPEVTQPLSANAWQKEGLWHFESGNFTQAEHLFRQVCTYYPENGWGWLNLLFALLNQSKDPIETIQAIIGPSNCKFHQRISVGQVALQLSSVNKIHIDRLNQVVWINGETYDEPMGDFYFAPYSFQGRNLSPAQLAGAYPNETLTRTGYTIHHPWMMKLDHQDKVRPEGETVLETIMVENDLSIKCSICGKDITQLANSDGRAASLGDEITYWCETCCWTMDTYRYSYKEDDEYLLFDKKYWWHRNTGRVVELQTVWFSENKSAHQDELRQDLGKLVAIHHPHTSLIIDFHFKEDSMKIVSVYYRGRNLADYLEAMDGEVFTCHDAAQIILDLSTGLEEIHKSGLTHGRIHPGMIKFVEDDLSQSKLSLADFYPSYYALWENPETELPFGANYEDLYYKAPQRLKDWLCDEPAWDLFSLGQILYKMLTGKLSYKLSDKSRAVTDPIEVMLKGDPVPIRDRAPDIPVHIAEFVDKAVNRQPEKRFQNISEFQTALVKVLEEL